MRSTIAALLIAAAPALFGATGDVPLSPAALAPLPGLAHVALATSGLEYLSVFARGDEIYWQQIAADGTPVDANARRLDDAELAQGLGDWIEVVWTGETYLLVWNEAGNTVVAQAIDPEGVVSEKFTILSGMTLRDAARWQHEVAVLSSVGSTWRLTLLNAYGAVLGVHNFSNPTSILQIVRLDEGWVAVGASGSSSGLTIVNAQNGSSRTVAPDRQFQNVFASPAGGALLIGRSTLGVVQRNGTFVPVTLAHPVDRLTLDREAIVSPTPSGWVVIYRSGGAARIAKIGADGTVASDAALSGPFPYTPANGYFHVTAASVRDENQLLLQPAPVGTTLGLESIGVAGSQAYATGTLAIGDAVQQWAETAHGPGVDLVVWIESGFQGWDIRATRVQDDGTPLDEEGILVGTTFPASIDAVFDGETFSVVWSDKDGIFMRRLDLHGNLADAQPVLVSTAAAVKVGAAGSGDGGLLVSWLDEGPSRPPQPTVAYVRGGRVRNTAWVGSIDSGYQMEPGGSRQSYLVAFADLPTSGCRFNPCVIDFKPVRVQLINPDGSPTGGPVAITEPMGAIAGTPVSHGGEWFVPIVHTAVPGVGGDDVARVVRLTGSASSVLGEIATIPGQLRSVAGGLAILGAAFRGMLGADPENLWFEPLPLDEGDLAEDIMAASETLLVDTGTRYVLRPLASPAESADIAVVRGARLVSGSYVFDTVRIEHRGGDAVPALHVAVWPETLQVTSPIDIVDGWMEGPFEQGDAIEIVVRGYRSEESLVAVLPDARETAAADNFLVIEKADEPPPPPPSKRRRLVGRP